LKLKKKDKLSVREIMMRFRCDKTQIWNTLKQKDKITNEWLQGNEWSNEGEGKVTSKRGNQLGSVWVVHESKIKKTFIYGPNGPK
jgi:hypothetical protein